VNPYAPPQADVGAPPAVRNTGEGWRIENDRLLVRDGAVLPDVCVLGGGPRGPGRRRRLLLCGSSGFLLPRPVIKVFAFQSRLAVLKRSVRLFGGVVLGFVAGVGSSFVMVGDGSATTASITVSFSLIGLGFLVTFWQGHHGLRITEVDDGWYSIAGISPEVIGGLKEDRAFGASGVGEGNR
jgi:hypothetical protein